ncbi:MAG: hypothetical protein JNL13_03220 [Chitinophagaceae bacterium]|nr:hypothetical protein [Chitinophagaceae bacterium]
MNELPKVCLYTHLEEATLSCDIPFLQWILSRVSVAQPEIRAALEKAIALKIAYN